MVYGDSQMAVSPWAPLDVFESVEVALETVVVGPGRVQVRILRVLFQFLHRQRQSYY